MARAWRRTLWAAVAATLLGGACVLGTPAWAADEKTEEAQAQGAPEGQADQPGKGGKKRQDPAEAQRSIEAALKQVQAGRPEQALPSLTATLAGGNLPPAILARAFYVRGMAFRAQRRPAQAISDLNSALWLRGGLGGEDRDGALKERAAAYVDAGLGDQGEVASAPAPATGGGSWLSGLFGSPGSSFGGSSQPPASRPPPVAAPAPAAESPAARASSASVGGAWTSSTTQAQPARQAVAATVPAAPPPRAGPPPRAEPPVRAAPARTEGRYQVQLGALRTEAEAQALVAKARREAALASLQPAIDHAVIGNFGSFYRVRFGPFASTQEAQGVCARLQGAGFDCMPVGP